MGLGTLALIAGGLYLATRKPKKKRNGSAGKPPGYYELKVGEGLLLKLPRDTGYWIKSPIPGVSGPGDIKVFNHSGDPLNVSRVEGVAQGGVKVQYFADPEKTDLVGEYDFQVKPVGQAQTVTVQV